MGIAAYNRSSALISRQLRLTIRERNLRRVREVRDRLNVGTKRAGTCHVTQDLQLWYERGVWWVQPKGATGRDQAIWYPTLKAAIFDWPNHYLIGMEDGRWVAAYALIDSRR